MKEIAFEYITVISKIVLTIYLLTYLFMRMEEGEIVKEPEQHSDSCNVRDPSQEYNIHLRVQSFIYCITSQDNKIPLSFNSLSTNSFT